MLTIEHLNCGYGKHEILHDISVTIPDKKDYCHRLDNPAAERQHF